MSFSAPFGTLSCVLEKPTFWCIQSALQLLDKIAGWASRTLPFIRASSESRRQEASPNCGSGALRIYLPVL
jgi:hypothetical protein